jgi:hypothetical protein
MGFCYPKNIRKKIEQEFRLFKSDKSKVTEITRLLWRIVPTNNPQEPIYKLAHYGLLPRLKILERCIENIFSVTPIDLEEPLTEQELLDSMINQTSFFFNLYGALENILDIYAIHIDFKGRRIGRSFFSGDRKASNELFKTLPRHIQKELSSGNEWVKYIKTARNFLAHREPFYVSPQTISAEQLKKWNALEMRKSIANRAYWEKRLLEPDNFYKLRTERDLKISEIEKKQLEHISSHPAMIVDINNRQDPLVKIHLPMLKDMGEIYKRILLVLNHIVKSQNSKLSQG